MKVALYARVSMEETDDGSKRYQEPENQLQPLRSFARSLGYEITAEYTDRSSGSNPNRPEFRKMLQDAMMRRFDGIVVWKLDRFSREGIQNTLAYIRQLKERGIWVKSMTEGWMDTSQEGVSELLLAIFSWVAMEERKKISERTKAGIRRLRAIGQWSGGRPKRGGGVAIGVKPPPT
jgi:DNA invertase Pin-like site-specific DNA recombinase